MQGRSEYPGRLNALTPDECWALLPTRQVGRAAWAGPDGITVIPVNFVVEHTTIVLRTTPHSDLAQHAIGRDVGFEVDHVDEERRSGWSVLVRGRCHRADPAPTRRPDVWVDGTREVVLRIHVRSVSGRRITSFFEAG